MMILIVLLIFKKLYLKTIMIMTIKTVLKM